MITPLNEQHYLDVAGERAFLGMHAIPTGQSAPLGALICPPFGWDEVCAYRPLRAWADRLSTRGIPTARLSYPSTGDSGGEPGDPGRLDAWTAAVSAAAAWLRARGCAQVAVIGLELGGLLAYRAAAAGADIDALVIWATPARGERLLRQWRAFAALEEAEFYEGLPAPPALSAGQIEAGGFLISAETAAELAAVDLSALRFAADAPRRALLLDRDGLPVDTRLRTALESAGSEVTVADGTGYADTVSHAQTARASWPVWETIVDWLAAAPAPRSPSGADRPGGDRPPQSSPQLSWPGGRETPITIAHGEAQLAAILTQPEPGSASADLGLVMLNAGAIRRVGPNRMWTEAARRWAARGVASIRLDFEGMGESSGPEQLYAEAPALYVSSIEGQISAAIDRLLAEASCTRVMLIGMCSGAYWAIQLAVSDRRVTSAFSVNPRALIWDEGLSPARTFRSFWLGPVSIRRLRRALRSERLPGVLSWLARSALRRLTGPLRPHPRLGADAPNIDALLDALHASGARACFTFAADEPLLDELARGGQLERMTSWDTVRVEHLAVRDHLVRPTWAQRQLHDGLDAAIERELEFEFADGGSGPGRAARGAISAPV